MDEKDAKLIKFLERAIPSYIVRARDGEWNDIRASRYFSELLKKVKDRKKAQELLNLFNRKLRESHQRAKGLAPAAALKTISASSPPVVIIDGPSTIGPSQSITLTGKTIAFPIAEGYGWQLEGGLTGVFHGLGELMEDGSSKSFVITTSPECKNGVLYLTAIGTRSEAYGSVTIQIIGGAEAEKDPEDEENNGEDDKEKSPEEKAEEEKKKEDEAKQKQEDEQQQKATLADWFNKEARKKILDGIKKKFSKEALAAFWKAISPYMPWIILGIVILIIGIAIMSGITADAGTGKAGSTFKKPADPVTDSAAIEKTIIAAGDKETVAKVNDQTFTDIQKQLTQLEPSAVKNSSPISQTTKDKITETSTKINQYLAKKDPVLGREIITSVKSILESTNEQAPAIAVKTRLPLETISGFNWELHYGTPLRKEMPTEETGHSTYIYYGEGKADAVDLYTNQSALVYPMFDGQIVNISDDGTGHKKVVIKNGDYELLYAHIDLEKNIGQGTKVTTDKSIGQVATISEQSQLHLELSCGGIPIITTLLDKLNYEQTVGKSWGEFLWTHIKKVLGQ